MEKAVIIIFDRGHKSQFTSAKPILDKYGFKVSFLSFEAMLMEMATTDFQMEES